MNIPATGPNATKEKFFREVANSFEFLAIYYSLTAEKQAKLTEFIFALSASGEGESA